MKKIQTNTKYQDFFKEASKTLSPRRIKRANQKAKAIMQMLRLSDLRKSLGVRQTEITGFTQSNVSRLEARTDMKISTLVEYVHSLGLAVEIKVRPRNKKTKEGEVILLSA